jgi:hypothetical protein
MKSTILLPFLFITLIACANEKKPTEIKPNDTVEEIESVAEPILNDNIGMKSNLDSSTISDTKSIITESKENKSLTEDEEKIETIEEIVEVQNTEQVSEEIETTPIVTEPIIEKIPEPIIQVKAEIHKTWDDLLKKHVSSSGKVNYAGFVKDKVELLKYIKELQSFHKDVSSWGKNKRLAYWINVYNAVTVKLITDNYPIKSINNLNGGKPWDKKLIDLGGTSYTLNVIENKIIRPKYNEPRIHFAVNCAAKSCPKIMNKAWTEDNIRRYLTKQTKAFIANTTENNISASKVELSKIFDWYKVDFGGDNTKLIQFINKYSDVKVNENATVTFKEYNWELND